MMNGFIVIGIIFWILLSCWAGRIAKRKGYSYGAFWLLTFFTGLIGFIIAACLGNMNQPVKTVVVSKDRWQCNKCGNFNDDGLYCKKCGEKRHSANGWLCTECMTYNDEGEFCNKCGKSKFGNTPKTKPINWKCEYCGRLNPAEEYQCQGCGSRREK